MRVVVKKRVERDYTGGKTRVTKIVFDDVDGSDILRLMNEAQQGASPRLGSPAETNPIDVNERMQAAARKVFLSPERIEALRETLNEVYRAMEQARRSGC